MDDDSERLAESVGRLEMRPSRALCKWCMSGVVPGPGHNCALELAGYITKDSGSRRSFDTGSQRDSADGKGRYDLLPWEAVHRVAQLYERGAVKYDPRNWEKGQPLSVVLNSMLRHAFQAAAGLDDEDHLAAVAWNAFAAITIKERIAAGLLPAELDDLPKAA